MNGWVIKDYFIKENIYFEGFDIRLLIDDQLEEVFVNWLEMGPGGVEELGLIMVGTSSSSIPISPFVACFLSMGRGRKIFFSIILMM